MSRRFPTHSGNSSLSGDGASGEDSFSIDRLLNGAEAGLSFVENKQPLAMAGRLMKSAYQWPGAPRSSTSVGRSVIERRYLMKLAGLPPVICLRSSAAPNDPPEATRDACRRPSPETHLVSRIG